MMSNIPDRRASVWTAIAVCAIGLSGCAALHPVPGVPIERLDACLLQPERPRTDERTIDLSLLGQPRPLSHVVDAGDVLGVFIEGVLGDAAGGPPVVSPSLGATPGALTTATVASASLGYPVTVRDDGTISLPYKPPIAVRGLTMGEVELRIRETYSGPNGLLQAGRDRIFITLHKPRTVRVLVVRKDRPLEPSYAQPPDYRRAEDARGTAVLVELPAYENDVLHALVASGGLPGPDAENAVYVMRAGGTGCGMPALGLNQFGPTPTPYPGHGVPLTNAGPVSSWLPTPLSRADTATARPIHADAEFPTGLSSTDVMPAAGRVLATLPISANVDPMSLPYMNQPQLPGGRNAFAVAHAGHGVSSLQTPYPSRSTRLPVQAAPTSSPWATRSAAPNARWARHTAIGSQAAGPRCTRGRSATEFTRFDACDRADRLVSVAAAGHAFGLPADWLRRLR